MESRTNTSETEWSGQKYGIIKKGIKNGRNISMCVCVYTYTHTHTHTHIYIYKYIYCVSSNFYIVRKYVQWQKNHTTLTPFRCAFLINMMLIIRPTQPNIYSILFFYYTVQHASAVQISHHRLHFGYTKRNTKVERPLLVVVRIITILF